jgi:response regulator RpfG family c-di-GMP phosphodiesterase
VAEARPKVLCVDDEPNILEGLKRQLRRKFDVETAPSGALALSLLEAQGPFAVLISDMRMPQMDGAQLLAAARVRFPDTVRILLTGYSEVDAAIRAVNDGHVFRFLCKPCSPETLGSAVDAGIEQHRLRKAEQELLENTLRGSIDALAEVLSLASPLAFGRARRIQRTAVELAKAVGIADVWQVEVAAVLSQLGAVTLPHDTLERWQRGQALRPDEQEMLARFPALAEHLLGHIPRLDRVRDIIQLHTRPFVAGHEDAVPVGARVLRLAADLDSLIAQGVDPTSALDVLESRGGYDGSILKKLRVVVGGGSESGQVREVPLRMLTSGMVLDQDLRTNQGMLLVTRGHTVGESLLIRLRNLGDRQGLPEFVRVVTR